MGRLPPSLELGQLLVHRRLVEGVQILTQQILGESDHQLLPVWRGGAEAERGHRIQPRPPRRLHPAVPGEDDPPPGRCLVDGDRCDHPHISDRAGELCQITQIVSYVVGGIQRFGGDVDQPPRSVHRPTVVPP